MSVVSALRAIFRCGLCGCGLEDEEWSREFEVVFFHQGEIQIAKSKCSLSERPDHIMYRSNAVTICILLKNPDTSFPSTDAFLFHASCVKLLEFFVKDRLSDWELFSLGQALQVGDSPHYRTSFAGLVKDFHHPTESVLPKGSLPKYAQWQPKHHIDTFYMPPEIVFMTLPYLPAKTLVNFFCSSVEAFSYATSFCRSYPERFHSVFIEPSRIHDANAVIIHIYHRFSDKHYAALDRRWSLVADIQTLSKHVTELSDTTPDPHLLADITDYCPTAISAPLAFGCSELIKEMPDEIFSLRVYAKIIFGRNYVCGLEWRTATEKVLVGDDKSDAQREIPLPGGRCESLHFIRDSYGVRNLKFGHSEWSFGGSTHAKGMEILSLRCTSKIYIIADCLKFRHITWDLVGDGRNIFWKPTIPCNGAELDGQFLSGNCVAWGRNSAGYMAARAHPIYFPCDMTGVTMYFDEDDLEIVGIRVHSPERARLTGQERALSQFFGIQSPAEKISKISGLKRNGSQGLALAITTTWDREFHFGSIPRQRYQNFGAYVALRPSRRHIPGIFVDFNQEGKIKSFGLIDKRWLGSPSKKITRPAGYLPVRAVSRSALAHLYDSTPKFETRAGLRNIRSILFYHESGFCVGMQFTYNHGPSDIIGQKRETPSRRKIFGGDEEITKLRITYGLRDGERAVKNIEFQTDMSLPLGPGEGNMISLPKDKHMAMAWWYTPKKDYISIFNAKTTKVMEDPAIRVW